MLCKQDPAESELLAQFLRIQHKDSGRSLEGTNCWGAILLWYELRLGINVWDLEINRTPGSKFSGKAIDIENYYKRWKKVSKPGLYDVILFKVGDELHAGFYLRDGKFFHICKAGGAICSIGSPEWRDRVIGYYHLKDRDAHNG
jgi:cell wall-associated NlpC family hydrolase